MSEHDDLLSGINLGLPEGIDWREGARQHLARLVRLRGRDSIEPYVLNKPFQPLPADNRAFLDEFIGYLNNFANLAALVHPHAGLRVLDAACGGGWVSHYMAKLGCETVGLDISEDFIALARRRVIEDSSLGLTPAAAEAMYRVHDIEAAPPPADIGLFDVIVLESSLHQMLDPVAAMTHLAQVLKDDGCIVIVEGANHSGPIRDEWLDIMRRFETLTRPYPREQLTALLNVAGLPHQKFLGKLNGWFTPDDPVAQHSAEHIRAAAQAMNLCVCAKSADVLARLFPYTTEAAYRGFAEGDPLQFGAGFFPLAAGFRWCGPVGRIVALQPLRNLKLAIHGATRPGFSQTVAAYGPDGPRGRARFGGDAQKALVPVGDLEAGDVLTVCSDNAFNPVWNGELGDDRLLSFYISVRNISFD